MHGAGNRHIHCNLTTSRTIPTTLLVTNPPSKPPIDYQRPFTFIFTLPFASSCLISSHLIFQHRSHFHTPRHFLSTSFSPRPTLTRHLRITSPPASVPLLISILPPNITHSTNGPNPIMLHRHHLRTRSTYARYPSPVSIHHSYDFTP